MATVTPRRRPSGRKKRKGVAAVASSRSSSPLPHPSPPPVRASAEPAATPPPPPRGDRTVDRLSAWLVLVAWFGLAAGSASFLRPLLTDGGPGVLTTRVAVAVTVGSLLLMGFALAARLGRVVGPVEHDGGPTPGVTPTRRRLVGFAVLPLVLFLPLGVALMANGRYDDDAAGMPPMIVAGLLPICLSAVGRPRLAATTTVGWLVLTCAAFWVPAPWPELGFASLAILGWGELVRWGYSLGRVHGQGRGRTATAMHLAVLALLSVLLLLTVPVGLVDEEATLPPPRTITLSYLAPGWEPRLQAEEADWFGRLTLAERIERYATDPAPVRRSWKTTVFADGPDRRRWGTSVNVTVVALDPAIAATATGALLEDARDPLDRPPWSRLAELPSEWEGVLVNEARRYRAVALRRVDTLLVQVSCTSSSSGAEQTVGAVRDVVGVVDGRGIVGFAADTDPLR